MTWPRATRDSGLRQDRRQKQGSAQSALKPAKEPVLRVQWIPCSVVAVGVGGGIVGLARSRNGAASKTPFRNAIPRRPIEARAQVVARVGLGRQAASRPAQRAAPLAEALQGPADEPAADALDDLEDPARRRLRRQGRGEGGAPRASRGRR